MSVDISGKCKASGFCPIFPNVNAAMIDGTASMQLGFSLRAPKLVYIWHGFIARPASMIFLFSALDSLVWY